MSGSQYKDILKMAAKENKPARYLHIASFHSGSFHPSHQPQLSYSYQLIKLSLVSYHGSMDYSLGPNVAVAPCSHLTIPSKIKEHDDTICYLGRMKAVYVNIYF